LKYEKEYLDYFLDEAIHDKGNKKRKKLSEDDLLKLKSALDASLDIRKFEIEMYWKRATYFWGFIVIIFSSYFVILTKINVTTKDLLPLALVFINCIGVIFSYAWFLINKGSKFWQENWEKHVDKLENHVHGPLYKIVLNPDTKKLTSSNFILRSAAVSVSKVNQFVSFVICVCWFLFYVVSFSTLSGENLCFLGMTIKDSIFAYVLLNLTIISLVYITFFSRSSIKKGSYELIDEKTFVLRGIDAER